MYFLVVTETSPRTPGSCESQLGAWRADSEPCAELRRRGSLRSRTPHHPTVALPAALPSRVLTESSIIQHPLSEVSSGGPGRLSRAADRLRECLWPDQPSLRLPHLLQHRALRASAVRSSFSHCDESRQSAETFFFQVLFGLRTDAIDEDDIVSGSAFNLERRQL